MDARHPPGEAPKIVSVRHAFDYLMVAPHHPDYAEYSSKVPVTTDIYVDHNTLLLITACLKNNIPFRFQEESQASSIQRWMNGR
jgi:hypothetical protein